MCCENNRNRNRRIGSNELSSNRSDEQKLKERLQGMNEEKNEEHDKEALEI